MAIRFTQTRSALLHIILEGTRIIGPLVMSRLASLSPRPSEPEPSVERNGSRSTERVLGVRSRLLDRDLPLQIEVGAACSFWGSFATLKSGDS